VVSVSALVVKDGFIEPNDEPGLGLTIHEDILADYPAIAGHTCRRAENSASVHNSLEYRMKGWMNA
jgi:hypothetical protein